jgi:transposase-like protein
MSFKLAVVREYEENKISLGSLHRKYGIQGSHTVRRWLERYGNFDWENKDIRDMGTKTKEQELLELRQKVKELERKNTRLEKELDDKDHKVAFFDLMIDMAEKEFKVDIRKKSFPEQ